MQKNLDRKRNRIYLAVAAGLCLALCGMGQPVHAEEGKYIYTAVRAEDILYGQKLGTSKLSGEVKKPDGTVLKGTLAWQNPEEFMSTAGDIFKTAIFTPEISVPSETDTAKPPDAAGGSTAGTEDGPDAEGAAGDGPEEGTSPEEKDPEEGTGGTTGQNQSPQQQTIPISVCVHVDRADIQVQEWPVIEKSRNVYDGEILRDAVPLQGKGQGICQVDRPAPDQTEPVAGSFRWQTPSVRLETGTQTVTLTFEPDNTANYNSCSKEMTIEVKPRPVTLQLQASDRLVMTGQEVTLTVKVNKTALTDALNGTLSFWVNGESAASGLTPQETDEGWTAEAVWSAGSAGEYSVQAVYEPSDNHTQDTKSREQKITAADPVSAFVTGELPEGKEGKEYEAVLETDASGKFQVRFSVTGGRLPDGLTLQEENGKISGIPKAAGDFTFTAAAAEGDAKVSGEYAISIKAKEKLAFSVVCRDVNYGEKVEAFVQTARSADLKYRLTFEGLSDTKYEKSETPPALPGKYRVKAVIEEPEDFAGQEVFQDFFIRKEKPRLTVAANPAKITGGGDVTLNITVENPSDAALKKGLPSVFSVSFDSAVKTKQSVEGKDGAYTYVFTAENRNGKVRCMVKSDENECYVAAQSYVDVETLKKEEPESKPSEKPKEEEKDEPEKKKEEEPVKKTPEEIEAEFWQDVIFRIYDAQDGGSTVTINAKGHKKMPDKVMDALRGHDRAALALVWEGDMIVIPAGKAQQPEKNRTEWTLAELSKLYPLIKPAAAVPKPQPKPQENTSAPSESAKPAAQGGQKPSGNKGGVTVHEKTETQVTQEVVESEESSEASEESSVSKEAESAVFPPETSVQEPEADSPKEIDWFLVAACVCAGTGVIVVTIAIAAMVKKKR